MFIWSKLGEEEWVVESLNFGLDYLQYRCFKTITDLRISCQFLSIFKIHRPLKPLTSILGFCLTDIHTWMSPKCMKNMPLAKLFVTMIIRNYLKTKSLGLIKHHNYGILEALIQEKEHFQDKGDIHPYSQNQSKINTEQNPSYICNITCREIDKHIYTYIFIYSNINCLLYDATRGKGQKILWRILKSVNRSFEQRI